MSDISELKLGDRVKCVGSFAGWTRCDGLLGTVIDASRANIGVQFDKEMDGHSCNGKAIEGHGRWGNARDLIKISNTSIMKKLSNFITKTVDGDTQDLLKAGYINGDLEPTEKAFDKIDELNFFDRRAQLVVSAKEEIAEQEKLDAKK